MLYSVKTYFFALLALMTSRSADLKAAAPDSNAVNKYPQALLVQINTEQSRIKALEKAHRFDDAFDAGVDARAATKCMIGDFTQHFTYCPVYYYADTNVDNIKKKNFEGVLLDSNGQTVHNVTPEHYVVCYYGYPMVGDNAGKKENTDDPNSRTVRGLVILNDRFEQVYYLYKLEYDALFMNKKGAFFSKHFDIEYVPFAKTFNQKLLARKNEKSIHTMQGRR